MRDFYKTCLRCGELADTEIEEPIDPSRDAFWYWLCPDCGFAWCSDDSGRIAYRKSSSDSWNFPSEGSLLIVDGI